VTKSRIVGEEMFSWALLNPVRGIVSTVAVCMGSFQGRVSGRSRGGLKIYSYQQGWKRELSGFIRSRGNG
jgi:hypothetical protein